MGEVAEPPAGEILDGVPDHCGQRGVHLDEAAIEGGQGLADGTLLEPDPEALDRIFGLLLGGDVPCYAFESCDRAIFVPQWNGARCVPEPGSVEILHPILDTLLPLRRLARSFEERQQPGEIVRMDESC